MKLKENERLDDLQIAGLHLIQNPEWFCFGIDAVLLSDFVQLEKQETAVDLGTGNAVVPILVSAKNEFNHITAAEVQPEIAALAKRNISLNNLGEKIKILETDVLDITQHIPRSSADVVFSNPPYFKKGGAIPSSNNQKFIARHETTAEISDFLDISSSILKPGGRLYMIHRPDRLVDIFYHARKIGLEPKLLQMVHPNTKAPANIALIKFSNQRGRELKLAEPLYVYNSDGSYTNKIKSIYNLD